MVTNHRLVAQKLLKIINTHNYRKSLKNKCEHERQREKRTLTQYSYKCLSVVTVLTDDLLNAYY